MKKFSIFAISALLLVAFSVPAMAKVNLSGGLWVTYWAQQQTHNVFQQNSTFNVGNDVASPLITAEKKTFLIGTSRLGNGLQANTQVGPGLLIVADCPVSDWVKGYAELNSVNGGAVGVQEAWANIAFSKEINLQAGLMEVPFGHEHLIRPDAGVEEVFISEYSQQAGSMLTTADVGVSVNGTVLNNMLDYNVMVANGSIRNVADTAAVTGGVVPDVNDAKQAGLALCLRPIRGLYVGGAYFMGDYGVMSNLGINQLTVATSGKKFNAYNFNVGYDFADVLELSGEYASVNHKEMIVPTLSALRGEATADMQDAKVSEYILKAVYSGISDVDLGLRYSIVDPRGMDCENVVGFSRESKLSIGADYKFGRGAVVKAEYSMVQDTRGYLDSYPAGSVVDQNTDPDDDILAIQLGLAF